ncbi:MAG: hypothetical protein RI637_05100 [Acidimicrobiia bacterium]|nr:hypothetical protein [Acidimicrobiia bacterium]
MEEALASLIAGANLLLSELAEGAYSLEVVSRDFRVIDHRNANEQRLVKTLSGGETFLVSLALALALAGPEGYVRTFVDEGEPMARLLRHALAERFGSTETHGIVQRYATRLLAGVGRATCLDVGSRREPARVGVSR